MHVQFPSPLEWMDATCSTRPIRDQAGSGSHQDRRKRPLRFHWLRQGDPAPTYGKYIYEVGYHILSYFLNDWDRFKNIPLGVLAHSTHLRGSGVMENGIEKPNITVTLASKIPAEDCARLNLGYLDPLKINMDEWQDCEDEGGRNSFSNEMKTIRFFIVMGVSGSGKTSVGKSLAKHLGWIFYAAVYFSYKSSSDLKMTTTSGYYVL